MKCQKKLKIALAYFFRSTQLHFGKSIYSKLWTMKTISHLITFNKILTRNGSFSILENTFEFPSKILALTSHQSQKIY
jgi:hypothetical protein